MLKYPGFLWLFLIYLPLIGWYIWKHRNSNPSMGLSSTKGFDKLPISWKVILMHVNFGLRLVVIGALIVALSRPQTTDHFRTSRIQGTDIAIALDISGSMDVNDFKPTRFEAAKEVASEFINNRKDDNMALVIFAGESLSLMPLTNDRSALINALRNVKMGDLKDGTAIGDGLISAINRLVSGKAKSKSVILITDGSNNAGDIAPSTAAEIAKSKGIKVYTIGIGTNGTVQVPDPYGFGYTTIETKIDEATLQSISEQTGGKSFRATKKNTLEEVFKEIDSLEKTTLDVDKFTQTDEDFIPWLIVALCAFCLELILRYTVLRRIP